MLKSQRDKYGHMQTLYKLEGALIKLVALNRVHVYNMLHLSRESSRIHALKGKGIHLFHKG